MKTYTVSEGNLVRGINLVEDPKGKLVRVVFLGEEGQHGQHYERVGLDRKRPAKVAEDGRVYDAEPAKVTLNQGTAREFGFWVLSAPTEETDAVLVRIRTEGTYTRDSHGGWRALKGQPETLIAGTGVPGDSGRLCSWQDGLVVMRPGDILRVQRSGGRKVPPQVLICKAGGELSLFDQEEWRAAQSGQQVEAAGAETIFGAMPVFSFGRGREGWGISAGIETVALAAGGRGFTLGPREDKWRASEKVTLVVAEGLPSPVTEAAVAEVGKRIVLVLSECRESGKCLVRVDTAGLRKSGRTGATVLFGAPILLTEGWMEIGTANVQHHRDQLWVLSEGDVLRVGQVMKRYPTDYALYVEGGRVCCEPLDDWERRDAGVNPEFYRDQNRAVPSRVPAEWIGRPVMIVEESSLRGERVLDEKGPFVLTSIDGEDKVTVDLGWERPDPNVNWNVTYRQIWWVVLRPDLKPPEAAVVEAALGRQKALEQQLAVLTELLAVAEPGLAQEIRELASAWTKDEAWEARAEAALEKFEVVRSELQDLNSRQEAGAIMVNFQAKRRRVGAAGLCDGWVIRPDGSQREPDRVGSERHSRSLYWRLVAEEELALQWQGGLTGEVRMLPVGGCTEAQLAAVAAIETELKLQPNAFGLNAEAQKAQEELVVAVKAALGRSLVLRSVPELEYHSLVSNNGQHTDEEDGHIRGKLAQWQGRGSATTEIDGRQAELLEQFQAGAGLVQVWLYFKYGHWNVAIRWYNQMEGYK